MQPETISDVDLEQMLRRHFAQSRSPLPEQFVSSVLSRLNQEQEQQKREMKLFLSAVSVLMALVGVVLGRSESMQVQLVRALLRGPGEIWRTSQTLINAAETIYQQLPWLLPLQVMSCGVIVMIGVFMGSRMIKWAYSM